MLIAGYRLQEDSTRCQQAGNVRHSSIVNVQAAVIRQMPQLFGIDSSDQQDAATA